jgi:hypothetical protein
MTSLQRLSATLFLSIFAISAHASNIPLQNLSSDDMNKIDGDMSANFLHTSVEGAGTLGHIWGFEVGVVGGKTSSPHLNDVVHSEADPNADAGTLYHGELLGVLSVPLGITGEIGVVPSVGSSDFKFNALDLAAKWTLTETLLSDLPFSLAVKGSYTSYGLTFSGQQSGVTVDYKYTGTETALMGQISKNFAIVEPYVSVGVVNGKGTLTGNGSSGLFQAGVSGDATRSGLMWNVGAEVKLIVFKLGAEYTSLFNTSRMTGKLSFYF